MGSKIKAWSYHFKDTLSHFAEEPEVSKKLLILEYDQMKSNLKTELPKLVQFLTGKHLNNSVLNCVSQKSQEYLSKIDQKSTPRRKYKLSFYSTVLLESALGSYKYIVSQFNLLNSSFLELKYEE